MKTNKLFFALVAAVSLVSACQKDVTTPVKSNEGIISFGVKGIGVEALTKAYSENTATEIQANGFNVAGITGTTLIFNEKATYAESKYSPVNGPYYYPASGTMDFYAVYPVSQEITVASGVATLSYTQDVDTDLLAAKSTGVSASGNPVALTFDHIKTLMKFKAVGNDTKAVYKVTGIKVTAPTSGTYAYAAGSWTNGTTTDDYVYSSSTTTISGTTDIEGAITILPCTPTISVTYDVYAQDGTTLVQQYSKSAALSSAVSIGKTCTVTLHLPNDDVKDINFTITVNPWGSESQDMNL